MLDRSKIAKEVAHFSDRLFKERLYLSWFIEQVWQSLTSHPTFLERIQNARTVKDLPTWQNNLGDMFAINTSVKQYAVLAVDGSQIYPDRHLDGVECFLINTGSCFLEYVSGEALAKRDGASSSVKFISEPALFVPAQIAQMFPGQSFSPDIVDLIREEKEFCTMVTLAKQKRQDPQSLFVALFDGNLLFWHLESKTASLKEIFIKRYIASLEELYQERIVISGYLSSSKFRDLVNLFDVGICDEGESCGLDGRQLFGLCSTIESLTDVELLSNILKPGTRTTIFYSNANIVDYYPEHLKPCFFYLHVGSEIVRLEIPFWVAQDPVLINQVCAVALDQVTKGHGYPVALAEAHAQAVIQGADRDFFFNLIYALGIANNRRVMFSQKNLKKKLLSM